MLRNHRFALATVLGSLALSAAALMHPAAAQASLEVCNKTGERIDVAVAYTDDGSNYQSHGWWSIADGSCATPISENLQYRYLYLYAANNGNGDVWGGTYDFCLNKTDKFDLEHADSSCDFDKVGFLRLDTGTTAQSYSYTFFPKTHD